VRSAPARSAVVAVTVAGTSAVGVRDGGLALECGAVSLAVVVVARRSPMPERIDQANAWARAGASATAIWMAATIEAILVAWVPALVGGLVGLALLQARGSHAAFGDGAVFLPWQLGALGLGACLPTSRAPKPRDLAGGAIPTAGRMLSGCLAAFALVSMFGLAVQIRTDLDLSLNGLFIIVMLVLVGVVGSEPISRGLFDLLGRVRPGRAIAAMGLRQRSPVTVRLVVVGAVTIATATTILGASVQARPDTAHALGQRIAKLPVLPRDVALLRVEPASAGRAASRPQFTAGDVALVHTAINRLIPNAETIPLRALAPGSRSAASLCPSCESDSVVVADPRLRSIYGGAARYPAPQAFALFPPKPRNEALTRVPPVDAVVAAVQHGRPLPAASFSGAVYYEVRAKKAAGIATTVSAVFIRAPKAFTATQLSGLAAVARELRPASGRVTLIGPNTRAAAIAVTSSLRDQSWAAASVATRWKIAGAASAIVLVTLVATLAIDTIDRRRDVRRLERLGATPRQVRGAAAAYAAALLAAVSWTSALLVVALVKLGTVAFNHAEPSIPVPFAMPWAVVVALTIGLPAAGAALAALIVRPVFTRGQ